MEIKKVTIEDLEKIAAPFKETFNKKPWEDGWSLENAKIRMREIIDTPRFVGYLAVEADRVLGAILGNISQFAKGKCCDLYEFFVIEEARNQGLGQKLYNSFTEELRKNNCKTIFLTTNRDSAAYKFYLKNNLFDIKSSAVIFGKI